MTLRHRTKIAFSENQWTWDRFQVFNFGRILKIFFVLIISLPLVGPFHFFGVFAQVDQPGSSSIFPNATSRLPGAPSIVPGLHAMSLVSGVKSTWLIISSDNELSLNLRYTGIGTSPPLSVFATAMKNTTLGQQGNLASPQGFQRITGSNLTNAGWMSPMTIPIRLQGDMSLYDADLIIVMIVPLTNSSAASNTTASTITSQGTVS